MAEPARPREASQLAYAMPIGNLPGTDLSPRQRRLTRLWNTVRCATYDGRSVAWDGTEHMDGPAQDALASARFIPPGYYDMGGALLPLRFRRPTAPYYLAKLIVARFSGLLFSSQRHPRVAVAGDPATEEFLNASIETGRLWARMFQARTYGGAMGAVGLGFTFRQGVPSFEVFDPRWCTPEFVDPTTRDVASLETRFAFTREERDRTGNWVQRAFWYRRVLDDTTDTVWPEVPVGDGSEPAWEAWRRTIVEHSFGECPVVWVQNLPVEDELDGDPDCHGTYDMIEEIDALTAQGCRGIKMNCDPTLFLTTDAALRDVAKGSDNAIKLEKGGSATYLEIAGQGPKAAFEAADRLEEKVCRTSRVVLDQARSATTRTATEVDHDYSAMWEQGDVLREQYGECGVKRLLEKYLRACRTILRRTRVDAETGLTIRARIVLPPKIEEQKDGTALQTARTLGDGEVLMLKWPAYTRATADNTLKRVQSAGQALGFGLVDREHAANFLAEDFQVEDVTAMLENAISEMQNAAQDPYAGAVGTRNEGPPAQEE